MIIFVSMVRNRIYEILLVFVIIMLFWRGCEIIRDKDNLLQQISQYKIGEKEFKNRILKDSSTLSTQTQTILTQDEAIKLGLLKLAGDIKKVQSQVTQIQNTQIDSIYIPYTKESGIDTSSWMREIRNGQVSKTLIDSLMNNSVLVPKTFNLENKWYNIAGKVKKDGVLMDSIKMQNESSVTIGWRNAGFLGLKKEPVVEIKNTNPYLSVSKMNNVIVKNKKGIFQSPYFWIGVGVIGGRFLIK